MSLVLGGFTSMCASQRPMSHIYFLASLLTSSLLDRFITKTNGLYSETGEGGSSAAYIDQIELEYLATTPSPLYCLR